MSVIVLAPILLAFVTGIFLISVSHPLSKPPRWSWVIASLSFSLQLLFGLILTVKTLEIGAIQINVGGWAAPYGIALYADAFSGLMISVCSLVGLAAALYLPTYSARVLQLRQGLIHPLIQFLFIGVHGTFIAGDLFNLYVWFEVLLISSFILLTLAGNLEKRATRGALKYVVINLLSSFLFLVGIALVYAKVGTLNLQDIAQKMPHLLSDHEQLLLAPFFVAAFGIKSAIFPLFFWLPDSYPTATPSISGLFAGILTKVGVYAFMRVIPLMFAGIFDLLSPLLIVLGILTMIIGVAAAATRKSIREILSFHIISQIGYMIFAFSLGTKAGLAAATFYLLHHIVAKANLFFIGGLFEQSFGSDRLEDQGGLLKSRPYLALLFIPPAMALAGMPPFSGFFAKLLVLQSGLEAKELIGTIAAVVVGFFTLYSMTKIWNATFWGPVVEVKGRIGKRQVAAVSLLSAFSVGLGLCFLGVNPIAEQVGHELWLSLNREVSP